MTLSPRQAAEIAGLGITRTYRLLRQGIMPSIPDPDGRGSRIPKSALLRQEIRIPKVSSPYPFCKQEPRALILAKAFQWRLGYII